MVETPDPISGRVGEVTWLVRAEWLTDHYWWRVVVAGNPKVLVRYPKSAVAVAEAIAADEVQFRRESQAVE